MDYKIKNIDSKDFNYSNVGEASIKQYLYLIDKKKYLNKLLKGKKRKKIVEDDFFKQEEKDIYEDLYEKDGFEEDIFDKDYKDKYEQKKEEQRKKYFDLKNACSFFDREKNTVVREENDKKGKILDKYNTNKYKYHLIHHHHDHYFNKSLLNLNAVEPACTSYNPRMEYIYKKIIYSPKFNKMIGRYELAKLKNRIEHQLEIRLKQKKEKELKNIQKNKLTKEKSMISLPKKGSYIDFINNQKNLSRRNKSIVAEKKSCISLFKNPNQRKIIYEKKMMNKEEQSNIFGSRNSNKKLFKRINSMFDKDSKELSLGLDNNNNNKSIDKSNNIKNSFDIKNIEEYEENNFDDYEKKKNISNCAEG